MQSVPLEMREKYFEQVNGRHVFRKDLRRSVIFGRHDLLQDAPISRIDLLACRNTLMYFNAEAQSRILSRFDFALNGGGFLFLGKAEVVLARNLAFTPVDVKRRVFAKVPKLRARDSQPLAPEYAPIGAQEANNGTQRLRDLALDLDPLAQVVADATGRLVVANAQARLLFGLSQSDLGQRLQDLPLAYRPVELRIMIEQAYAEHCPVSIKDSEWNGPGGETRYLAATVLPIFDSLGQRLGIKILFNDMTPYRRLQDELNQSRQELETTNEELQSSNEELETTNEELQSTVEELETTNEEIQSTSEEMETMNEELQSTNEELTAINNELRRRGDDLKRLNAFLESIMASLRDGVAVLDRDLQILAWNHKAEDQWGLRADEVVGKNFLNLDIGLPVEQVKHTIWNCVSEKTDFDSVVLAATNRRGKSIQVQVDCTRMRGQDNTTQGVILMMEERRPDSAPPGRSP
jgi:two-component system CheB/CheR fusion protein